jgi:hypothetical protein
MEKEEQTMVNLVKAAFAIMGMLMVASLPILLVW